MSSPSDASPRSTLFYVWIALLASALGFIAWDSVVRSQHVLRVSENYGVMVNAPREDVHSPTGYENGRRSIILPDRSMDGYHWIMQGNIDHVMPLTIHEVSRIHFRGGSHLGIARANPTTDPQLLENTIQSLQRLGVSQLITIGGDDTAFSAMKLAQKADGRVRVVHVPKTIDNDLDLPAYVDTFGYQTARDVGVEIVQNLMTDAKTTSRWYFVIAMGRKAGHLALGIGKAAGATLTLIPEEFGDTVKVKRIVDTLVAAIIKRLTDGRQYGVAVLAEGLVLSFDPEDFASFGDVEKDAHGHVRLAEVDLGDLIKKQVQARLKALGIKDRKSVV